MQQVQPTPTAPAPDPTLATAGPETPKMEMVAYALVALAGSGLVMYSSFLPWIGYRTYGNGIALYFEWTGWGFFSDWNWHGGFFIAHAFTSYHFSPLVTGLSTLILGALGAATAVMVLVSLRRPLPGRYSVPRALVVVASIVGVVLFIVPVVNLWSYFTYGKSYSLHIGLVVLLVGGCLAPMGLGRAMGTRPRMWPQGWFRGGPPTTPV